ncbi:YncE family protein, partial [bacterium]|nr:YncE family protein [bacterium]
MARRLTLGVLLGALIVAGAIFACTPLSEDEPDPVTQSAAVVRPLTDTNKAFLFVANPFFDVLYRVDLGSHHVRQRPIGEAPHDLAASADGRYVAVASGGSRSVTVVRSEDLVGRTVRVGFAPRDLAFSPDGASLAVANYDQSSVTIIDTGDFGQWEVPVGVGPISLAFDPTGAFLLVANFESDSVELIDMAERRPVAEWLDAPVEMVDEGGEVDVDDDDDTSDDDTVDDDTADDDSADDDTADDDTADDDTADDDTADDDTADERPAKLDLVTGLDAIDRPQVVTYGLPDTPSEGVILIGVRQAPEYELDTTRADSVIALRLPDGMDLAEYVAALREDAAAAPPLRAQIVEAGVN